jgi:hypothetical protein
MIDRHKSAPRRYFLDGQGHRVLIGLSPDETAEFEALDLSSVEAASELSRDRISEEPAGADEVRWLELYSKHESAWQAWMVQSRVERAEVSAFVNHV